MATLLLQRRGSYPDRFRKYRLEIDGRRVGTIRGKSKLRIEIPAGAHTARATIDWCGSNTVSFEVEEDEIIQLDVTTKLKGFRFFLSLFYIFFARKSYLTLSLVPKPNNV